MEIFLHKVALRIPAVLKLGVATLFRVAKLFLRVAKFYQDFHNHSIFSQFKGKQKNRIVFVLVLNKKLIIKFFHRPRHPYYKL
jgi:hypothetical protein